ncbi:MAG TPA: hypothetical protein VM345_16780 [Acidimicrobiales bacterium]|jgi:hypothetical protein|nr:hypothetical protein [Acidimicrobiales bacterium]
MAAAPAAPTDLQTKPYKTGERVIVTQDIRGVPEGTAGRVKMGTGLTWKRYWVEFANGRWVGSVSQANLVRAKDWEQFKKLREEERLRPKVVEAPAEASGGGEGDGGGAAAGGASSRVPAHLLERSRKARERLAGG